MASIKATVVKMGHEAMEFSLESSKTVGEVLALAGINAESSEGVRVNGRTTDLGSSVRDGDFITFNPKVSGGC